MQAETHQRRRRPTFTQDDMQRQAREAFRLYTEDGLTYIEIADIMGISPGTAKHRVHEGRALCSEAAPVAAVPQETELAAAVALRLKSQAEQGELIRQLLSGQQAVPITETLAVSDDGDGFDTSRIMEIGDIHAPFHHPDALPFLSALADYYRPTLTIQIGDEKDNHRISMHDHDPELPGYMDEQAAANAFLHELHALLPEIHFMTSNHGSLPFRQAFKAGLPSMMIRSYRESIFGVPQKDGSVVVPDGLGKGWHWHENLVVTLPNGNKVLHVHGYSANVELAVKDAGMCVVQGHHHSKMGVVWCQGDGGTRFGMATGTMINPKSRAFAYGKGSAKKPLVGCGFIIDSTPFHVPMWMDRHGRWTGQFLKI